MSVLRHTLHAAGLLACAGAAAVAGTVDLQPAGGEPIGGLSAQDLELFDLGKEQFEKSFLPEEGLGPIFNKQSCGNCHSDPVGGGGGQTVTRFGHIDPETNEFDPLVELGGSLLQVSSINLDCAEFVPDKAANTMTNRITSSVLGAGFVQHIPHDAILENEQNPPHPDVSGHVHMVPILEDPGADPVPGRFGWKAQLATLRSFSGDAALNEIGITNAVVGTENAPNGDDDLLVQCDEVPDPEDSPDSMGKTFIDRVVEYQERLAPPPQTPQSGMTGEQLFNQIGCNSCHVPEWTTSDSMDTPEFLRNETIRPYTDFLLHDMGDGGDFIVQGDAQLTEIKTTPLWGLRFRNPIWHDGSINGSFEERVLEAIERHRADGSEAAFAADNFFGTEGGKEAGEGSGGLTPAEQELVVEFLGSLGRRAFDSDPPDDPNGSNVVGLNDFLDFKACIDEVSITPDDHCAIHDVNQDGTVDETDFEAFQTVYVGDQSDCDDNGLVDIYEIAFEGAPDVDNNGLLDDCECVGDFNGDNIVDSFDLNVILGNFGGGAFADINGDGVTDSIDLNIILGNFGQPCPE